MDEDSALRGDVFRPLVCGGLLLALGLCVPFRGWCAEAGGSALRAHLPPRASSPKSPEPRRTLHRITLSDPVAPEAPPRTYRLIMMHDARGFPAGYALFLETHVCSDGQCRPVTVTMYWDALGSYQRLTHPEGKPLTKKDHAPFTDSDYAKLDQILKDPASLMATWTLDYLDKPVNRPAGADAVSQPTPVAVEESVVKDAAFTTWALWHWANGEIVPKLRQLTRSRCTPRYVNHLFRCGNPQAVDFGLDYAMAHPELDSAFAGSVFRVLERGTREQIMRSLEFLDRAVPDKEKLHRQLIDACGRMRATDCVMVLEKLDSQPDLSAGTLEALTERLDQLPYFPVHLILRVLEKRQFTSPRAVRNVAALLESEEFFIARRAYEHLRKQDLDPETERRVRVFHEQYSDRL